MLHLRHSGKKLSFLSRQFITSTQRFSSSTSKSGENVENIEIPNYIKRSPTDILRALSGTVGFDPTAPHYKYHDDPFLIPTSNSQKRIYALAQESGRKSAKWIRQTHADLFQVSHHNSLIITSNSTFIFSIKKLIHQLKHSSQQKFTPKSQQSNLKTWRN